ncbi:unnamed protein product [Cylindrotheca closterium]|uniref:Nitroreductase domain-containing protein n=1 Tax=Cylindrotheca closterium TaxID=2856 RepID=A0AAD2CNK7_9STRA|nr:unnamed protein product [Cylindrotheca closterium]
MQSLLQSRRTGTSMVFTLEDHQKEEGLLKEAIHRAVQCAQMAPNHKRTEPFSFLQIMNSSSSADQVAEIAYQVAARTRSVPVARKKKEKWSQIPAFLVTLVHKNQKAVLSDSSSGGSSSSSSRSDTVDEISDGTFEPLPYAPPETERQLEDYASASAAIQNVLLSLHADGIATKWATGPVICTPAFRKLVHAKPTDRIAGLIMVGGMDSTQFDSDKMEQITAARRRRRRDVDGDVLQSLLP